MATQNPAGMIFSDQDIFPPLGNLIIPQGRKFNDYMGCLFGVKSGEFGLFPPLQRIGGAPLLKHWWRVADNRFEKQQQVCAGHAKIVVLQI